MSQRESSQGSLFAAISEGVASQEDSAVLQKLEIGLGFLGFFAAAAVLSSLVAILSGESAVKEAVVTAVFVSLTYVTYRRWKEVGRRVAAKARARGRDLPR